MFDDNPDRPNCAQHDPPRHLHDPFVRRLPVTRAVWGRAMRGRIPKPADAAVAKTLAEYGNAKGLNCHPGIARLARDCCMSERAVKRSIAWLDETGWITRTAKAARKLGLSDQWRCTIPAPVAVELDMWDDENEGPQWMERRQGQPKRVGVRDRPPPGRPGPKPRNPDLQGTGTPFARANNSVLGASDSVFRGQSYGPPPQSLHTTSSNSHHSASVTRPHAAARGCEEELVEQIMEAAAEQLGYEPYGAVEQMAWSMAGEGRHPKAILNAVLAQELDYPQGA